MAVPVAVAVAVSCHATACDAFARNVTAYLAKTRRWIPSVPGSNPSLTLVVITRRNPCIVAYGSVHGMHFPALAGRHEMPS